VVIEGFQNALITEKKAGKLPVLPLKPGENGFGGLGED
jgi:hypothetical protein